MHMCSIVRLIFSPCLKCWPDRGRLASGLPQNDGTCVGKHHSYMGGDSRLFGKVGRRSTS